MPVGPRSGSRAWKRIPCQPDRRKSTQRLEGPTCVVSVAGAVRFCAESGGSSGREADLPAAWLLQSPCDGDLPQGEAAACPCGVSGRPPCGRRSSHLRQRRPARRAPRDRHRSGGSRGGARAGAARHPRGESHASGRRLRFRSAERDAAVGCRGGSVRRGLPQAAQRPARRPDRVGHAAPRAPQPARVPDRERVAESLRPAARGECVRGPLDRLSPAVRRAGADRQPRARRARPAHPR